MDATKAEDWGPHCQGCADRDNEIAALRQQLDSAQLHDRVHYQTAGDLAAETVALRQQVQVFTPHMAAGLLTQLKQECEAQHARAEAAEARVAALEAEKARLMKYAEHIEGCPEREQSPRTRRGGYMVIDSAFPCSCGLDTALAATPEADQ